MAPFRAAADGWHSATNQRHRHLGPAVITFNPMTSDWGQPAKGGFGDWPSPLPREWLRFPAKTPAHSRPLLRRTLPVSGLRRGDGLVVLRYRLHTVGDLERTDELRRREFRPDVLRSKTGSPELGQLSAHLTECQWACRGLALGLSIAADETAGSVLPERSRRQRGLTGA
jgi:hypothetical protein